MYSSRFAVQPPERQDELMFGRVLRRPDLRILIHGHAAPSSRPDTTVPIMQGTSGAEIDRTGRATASMPAAHRSEHRWHRAGCTARLGPPRRLYRWPVHPHPEPEADKARCRAPIRRDGCHSVTRPTGSADGVRDDLGRGAVPVGARGAVECHAHEIEDGAD